MIKLLLIKIYISYYGSHGHVFGARNTDVRHGWITGLPKYENPGDILKIILDLNKETLTFVINGKSHQIQIDDEYKIDRNLKYRLAVSLCGGRVL